MMALSKIWKLKFSGLLEQSAPCVERREHLWAATRKSVWRVITFLVRLSSQTVDGTLWVFQFQTVNSFRIYYVLIRFSSFNFFSSLNVWFEYLVFSLFQVRYHFLCSNHRSSKFSSDRSATENTVIDFKKFRSLAAQLNLFHQSLVVWQTHSSHKFQWFFSDKPDILLKDLIGIKHVGCSGDVRKVSHNINKDWVLCGSSLSIAEKVSFIFQLFTKICTFMIVLFIYQMLC